MCMFITDKPDLKQHWNFWPKTVYKILDPTDSPRKAISPFRHFEYIKGKLYRVLSFATTKELTLDAITWGYAVVHEGFHAFLNEHDARNYMRDNSWPGSVYKCRIPMFSKYYLGKEHREPFARTHIVSNRIRMIKEIK